MLTVASTSGRQIGWHPTNSQTTDARHEAAVGTPSVECAARTSNSSERFVARSLCLFCGFIFSVFFPLFFFFGELRDRLRP